MGRGIKLSNHSSGDTHDDDDSSEMLLTGHEPITTPVTSNMITDMGGGVLGGGVILTNREPVTTPEGDKRDDECLRGDVAHWSRANHNSGDK